MVFIFLFSLSNSYINTTAAPYVALYWTKVETLNTALTSILGGLVFASVLAATGKYGTQWNWRYVLVLTAIGANVIDAVVVYCTIYDVLCSQWFFLGVLLTTQLPLGINFVVGTSASSSSPKKAAKVKQLALAIRTAQTTKKKNTNKNNGFETPAATASKKTPRTDDLDGAPPSKKAKAKAPVPEKLVVPPKPRTLAEPLQSTTLRTVPRAPTPAELKKKALLARDSVDDSDLPPLVDVDETAGALVSPVVSPRRHGSSQLDVAALMRHMADENARSMRLILEASAAQSRVLAEDNLRAARAMANENTEQSQQLMLAIIDRLALLPTPAAAPAPVHEPLAPMHGGEAKLRHDRC
ncbi:hypothetical protein SDRG_13257 [Saprolegnia diclina VS20]|uniref:Uncharacterized protein n=1 Tax=Saprolegnia diclina (strain VS20) TaxID=1156394 RepID=T0Q2Z7_SAPDV|nr:hypothetical protein SDRG_13257 [Saprolegnia diclina VS20]EQC28916.1 hypothetical protein SDRG_13257 [Saprolegnia diclina VS20]|eukprot:XP_008617555.1 hypothetical protein SDRG_13257 [Saprolegnia diclina VS20]